MTRVRGPEVFRRNEVIDVLLQGKLIRDAERRTSRTGNDYGTAVIAAAQGEGEPNVVANVITFNRAAIDTLLALSKGDAVAITGAAKIGVWTTAAGIDSMPNDDPFA
jgi:single-stranded DNA-binding protein